MTQAVFSDAAPPPHCMEKGLRDLFPLHPAAVIQLILPFLDRAVSPSRSTDWWELARFPRERNGLRRPCPPQIHSGTVDGSSWPW